VLPQHLKESGPGQCPAADGALHPLLFDLGHTLTIEESEVKDAEGTTVQAGVVPGMAEALRWFKVRTYTLVTDSRPNTQVNVLRQRKHNEQQR
jgi:hypothetical protein